MKLKSWRHPRKVYENQEEVKRLIFEHLEKTQFYHPFIKKVYLTGSLSDGGFGIFDTPEHSERNNPKDASDVDLIIIGDDNHSIPNGWVKKEPHIVDTYVLTTLRGIEGIKDEVHKVEALVFVESKANEPIAMNPKLKGSGLEGMTKGQALPVVLKKMEAQLWYYKP